MGPQNPSVRRAVLEHLATHLDLPALYQTFPGLTPSTLRRFLLEASAAWPSATDPPPPPAAEGGTGGWTAHVDGASRGNPGQAALGVVLRHGREVVDRISRPLGVTTNNVAEYEALLAALRAALARGARRLRVCSDSQLLVRQLQGAYQVRDPKLRVLANEARGLFGKFEAVVLEYIPREANADADALANAALVTAKRRRETEKAR
jgi:ribonuclease HI